MARVLSNIISVKGAIGDYVIYDHPLYGTLMRRKRGTVKPAVLNDACRKANHNLKIANGYASVLSQGLRPYLEYIDISDLRPRLMKHILNEMKLNEVFSFNGLKGFPISQTQSLKNIVEVQAKVNWDQDEDQVHFTLSKVQGANQLKTLNAEALRFVFIAMYFKSSTELISTQSVQLPLFHIGRKYLHDKTTWMIPPNTNTVVFMLRCTGYVSGAASRNKKLNGIEIVDVVSRLDA